MERDLHNLPEESRQIEIAVPPPSEAGTDKYKKAARFILAAKLFSAPYAGNCGLEGIEFDDNVHKIIAEYIINCEKNGERVRPSELFEILDENCTEFNEILDLNYGDQALGRSAGKIFLGQRPHDGKGTPERKDQNVYQALFRGAGYGEAKRDRAQDIRIYKTFEIGAHAS